MDADLVRRTLALLEAGQDVAWATIIRTTGSAPRHGGASMLVFRDGSIAGTVGGGALEAEAIRQSLDALRAGAPRLMDFELTPEDSAGLGMVCGGRGEVLVDIVPAGDPTYRALLSSLQSLLDDGGKGWLVTTITQTADGSWAVSRRLEGLGGDGCRSDELAGTAGSAAARDDSPALPSTERTRTHVQPIGLDGTAFVFGAGHCGQKLVPVLSLAGFATVIVDDRADFAHRDLFPTADRVLAVAAFDSVMDGLGVDEDSYLVIVTRGHLHDQVVLAQALRTRACYVGMIGSRRKVATIFDKLRATGFTEDDLARTHAPIGVSIGAETPAEIAVSIAAELIAVRAGLREQRAGRVAG